MNWYLLFYSVIALACGGAAGALLRYMALRGERWVPRKAGWGIMLIGTFWPVAALVAVLLTAAYAADKVAGAIGDFAMSNLEVADE